MPIQELRRYENVLTGHDRPEEEAKEVFVVFEADAVSCPRTMVVHPHDTLITDAAVVCSRRPHIFTFLTIPKMTKAFLIFIDLNRILSHTLFFGVI